MFRHLAQNPANSAPPDPKGPIAKNLRNLSVEMICKIVAQWRAVQNLDLCLDFGRRDLMFLKLLIKRASGDAKALGCLLDTALLLE